MTLQNTYEQGPAPSLLKNLLYPYGLWALFALPGVAMTAVIFTSDTPATVIHEMIHPSGRCQPAS